MKTYTTLIISLLLIACSVPKPTQIKNSDTHFTIAFGSCNDQNRENKLWNAIAENKPNIWIWGGDNIYADTENMEKMKEAYSKVKTNIDYTNFRKDVEILGTWDDHDYGSNDAGLEYGEKITSQQLFLDFLDVKADDPRRKRKGIYTSRKVGIADKSIKIILLDTRYFRTKLTEDPTGRKRYVPNKTNDGTILGEVQWKWLKNELYNSTSDFNIIVSSIQFLSQEHGWETWGTMPNEVYKMQDIITGSKAKGIIFLSGDRHISEISMMQLTDLNYPLYDFTSSGLTHTYEAFKSETNKYRVSDVINKKNFGILKFNLTKNLVTMEIRGLKNVVLESVRQQY